MLASKWVTPINSRAPHFLQPTKTHSESISANDPLKEQFVNSQESFQESVSRGELERRKKENLIDISTPGQIRWSVSWHYHHFSNRPRIGVFLGLPEFFQPKLFNDHFFLARDSGCSQSNRQAESLIFQAP